MLKEALIHPRVTYYWFDRIHFDFSDRAFDLITFAGSLYYGKSQELLDEVVRVTKHHGKIIIYDFKLRLDDVFRRLNLGNYPLGTSDYDHQVNLDDLTASALRIEHRFERSRTLEISYSNLAHVLVSSKPDHRFLVDHLGDDGLHQKAMHELHSTYQLLNIRVDANTYATIYQKVKGVS